MGDRAYQFRTRVMTSLLRLLARPGKVSLSGIELEVAEGVHHPAPFLSLGFESMMEAALVGLPANARLLELGTGAGFWALAAARRGLDVTASDLPHIPLEPVQRQADRLGVKVRLLHSDLFAALSAERFDAIVFNPPFHDAVPRSQEETAWCGGEVVRRFLKELPDHLTANGTALVLLPRAEQRRYSEALGAFEQKSVVARWFPILGTVDLLELKPRAG